jgi:hypothetical protein
MEITVKIECDTLAAAIFALADALEGKNKNICAPERKDITPAAPVPVTKEESTPEKALTLEDVRDVMSNLPTAKVRELMLGFGVKKLTELDSSNYAALLAKAGVGA